MSEWKEFALSEITDVIKKTYLPKGGENLPYIGLEHIQQQTLRLDGIGSSQTVSSQKFKFVAGDVLFGKLRPYFRKVVRPKFDGICSTDIWVLRSKKGFSQGYVNYLVASEEFIETCNASESGTRMPRADWNYLKNTNWVIPPFQEQESIAEVLGSLDDKIDLLHKNNNTLEEYAEVMFRKWFIEENDQICKTKTLKELTTVVDNRGKTPPFTDIVTPYPVIEVNALTGENRYIDYRQIKKYVDETTFKSWFRSGHPRKNDILISTVGSIGEIAMYLKEKGTIAQNIVAFRATSISPYYLYQYLLFIQDEVREYDIGSVQPSIKVTHIQKIEIPIPNAKAVIKFDALMGNVCEKICNNTLQIEHLENLRNELIPKMMSGTVRVNNFISD
jgi:type I restriction enzyme S subunit